MGEKKTSTIAIIVICLLLVASIFIGAINVAKGNRNSKAIISDLHRENEELGKSLDRIRGKFEEIRTGINDSQQRIGSITGEVSDNTARLRQGILIVRELEELFGRIESIVFESDGSITTETN